MSNTVSIAHDINTMYNELIAMLNVERQGLLNSLDRIKKEK
jgi:hypothetical protein